MGEGPYSHPTTLDAFLTHTSWVTFICGISMGKENEYFGYFDLMPNIVRPKKFTHICQTSDFFYVAFPVTLYSIALYCIVSFRIIASYIYILYGIGSSIIVLYMALWAGGLYHYIELSYMYKLQYGKLIRHWMI